MGPRRVIALCYVARMICPFCQEEGAVSTLTELGTVQTLVMSYPHHDEYGIKHFHDWNTEETSFHCSRGHRFTVTGRPPCPAPKCEWPHRAPTIALHP